MRLIVGLQASALGSCWMDQESDLILLAIVKLIEWEPRAAGVCP